MRRVARALRDILRPELENYVWNMVGECGTVRHEAWRRVHRCPNETRALRARRNTSASVDLWEDHVGGKVDKHLHGSQRNESKEGAAALNMEAAGTLPPAMAATMGPKTP